MAARHTTSVDLFDIGEALKKLAGDVDLLQEIVEIFLDMIPGRLDELDRLIAVGDVAEVANQARELKSGAANFCAGQFETAALALEQLAKSGSLEEAQALLARLRSEFRWLHDRLSTLDWRTIAAIPRC
jgi:HPt (histidine-containing phosphotransfer) domain-containing protein